MNAGSDPFSAASDAAPQPAAGPPLLRLDQVTVIRSVPAAPAEEGAAATTAVRILDRLSLSLPAGTHTAILGPNGSGKTSLLKLLNRQFYPSVDQGQSGTVEIFGQARWEIDRLRKLLGVVSGELDREFSLPRSGRMTALQAVLSGFDGVQLVTFTDQQDRRRRERAARALDQVGAAALAHRPLMTLSTGERRRVLIARALVHEPRALVLDEPTTGLDVAASAAFLGHIRRLAEAGITIVLVTHHVEEIIPEIRHVVLLKQGRVFSQGDSESELRAEQLSALFEVPVSVQRDSLGRFLMFASHAES